MFALYRIEPHAPPLAQAPVNSFEFQPCDGTPQAECLTRKLGPPVGRHNPLDHGSEPSSFTAWTTRVTDLRCLITRLLPDGAARAGAAGWYAPPNHPNARRHGRACSLPHSDRCMGFLRHRTGVDTPPTHRWRGPTIPTGDPVSSGDSRGNRSLAPHRASIAAADGLCRCRGWCACEPARPFAARTNRVCRPTRSRQPACRVPGHLVPVRWGGPGRGHHPADPSYLTSSVGYLSFVRRRGPGSPKAPPACVGIMPRPVCRVMPLVGSCQKPAVPRWAGVRSVGAG